MADLPNGTILQQLVTFMRVGKAQSTPQDGIRDELALDRLAKSGMDIDYIREAEPALYRELQDVCRTCPHPEKCTRELLQGNWDTGLSEYCPNAAAIDEFIAGYPSSDA